MDRKLHSPRYLALLFGSTLIFAAGVATGYYLKGKSTVGIVRSQAAASLDVAKDAESDSPTGSDSAAIKDLSRSESERRIGRFADCLKSTSEDVRRMEWLILLQNLQPSDCLTIREMFRSMDRQGRAFPFEWDAFWKRWGTVDGAGALEYIKSEDPRQEWVRDIAGKTLFGLGSKDPDAAKKWLAEHQDSPLFNSAFTGYIAGVALTDFRKGTAYALEAIPAGHELLNHSMGCLAEGAAQQAGLTGVLEWFDQLPDDAEHSSHKATAISHVTRHLMQAGQAPAMEWLASKAGTKWRSDEKIGQVADWVAGSDPAKAMEWLTGLPPSPATGSYPGMTRVINRWAGSDPAAFETWLRSPKDKTIQDQAVAAYEKIRGQK